MTFSYNLRRSFLLPLLAIALLLFCSGCRSYQIVDYSAATITFVVDNRVIEGTLLLVDTVPRPRIQFMRSKWHGTFYVLPSDLDLMADDLDGKQIRSLLATSQLIPVGSTSDKQDLRMPLSRAFLSTNEQSSEDACTWILSVDPPVIGISAVSLRPMEYDMTYRHLLYCVPRRNTRFWYRCMVRRDVDLDKELRYVVQFDRSGSEKVRRDESFEGLSIRDALDRLSSSPGIR